MSLKEFLATEPVVTRAVTAVGAALLAFGLPIAGVLATVLKVAAGVYTAAAVFTARAKVTPNVRVRARRK